MSNYTPFDKELGELEASDLDALTRATEGWYIEYKREVPNALSIAKSVSAFANTYGGWIFYGVEEKSKEDAVAGSFPGVERTEVDASLQRIRQAVAGLMNPEAHFDTKVIWGSADQANLGADLAVICIKVPSSLNAPHVHKSGQIYRRVADGSEPKPENDRFILDTLFNRSKDGRKNVRRWLNRRDPEFSKGEGQQPYVRLMIVPDIWGDRNCGYNFSIEEVRELLGHREKVVVGNIPFDDIYTSTGGFVGRQRGNDPHNLGLTWRLQPGLISQVILPLQNQYLDDARMLRLHFDGYENVDRFTKLLVARGHKSPRVVDLNFLFNTLIGVAEMHGRIAEKAGWKHGFSFKAKLLNVWRTIPYLDVPDVIEGFEKHGIPMCLDRKVLAPAGVDPEDFKDIPPTFDIEGDYARIIMQAMGMFAPIARAYGLPPWFAQDSEGTKPPYYEALQLAGRRAMEVQERRNKRLARENM